MAFRYQAIDSNGQTVANTVDAASPQQAMEILREKGLFVTRLDSADSSGGGSDGPGAGKAGGSLRDVVFFTQQMSMLIRSGARVVQAMEAIEAQAQRAAWQRVVRSLREDVEQGRPLSAALARFPKLFSPIFVNMVAAGEASGNMPVALQRLAAMTRQQHEIRSRIIGALTYPAVLMTLCVGVLTVLFSVVLPRFAEMFRSLDVDLPATTAVLIGASDWTRGNWPLVLLGLGAAAGGCALFVGSTSGKCFLSRLVVRLPIFGAIVRNVILARICRVWGQLLDNKVSVLEAVRLTRDSTSSLDFRELLANLAEAITQGNSIGPPLRESWLLPKTFAAAIVTGEESGKLGDALLFVASCLDDDNAQVLSSLTRVIEPIMLVIMGLIVGTVAISLFLPMFDMATIAGG